MEHGRSHDERSQKAPRSRSNNTPPDPDERPDHLGAERGSAPAPTPRAAAREADRHRRERALGLKPAGLNGVERQVRPASVSREALDRAAREADEAVGAQPSERLSDRR